MAVVSIERSHSKMWLMFISAVSFVALGLWLQYLPPEPLAEHKRFAQAWLVTLISWSAILFFGICAVAISRKLLDRTPGLVISAQGIHDTSSAISFGRINWSDVNDIREYHMVGQRFVVIMMSSYDKLLSDAGPFKRKLHAANIRLCGSPVCICANPLKIDHTSLLRLLQEQFAKHQAAKN